MLKLGLNMFGSWVLINIILPMIIPILFFFLSGIIVNKPELWNFDYIWDMLMRNGVFMFLGLTFLLSVYQDYRDAQKAFNWMAWIMLIVVIMFTGFLFISSMDIIPGGRTFNDDNRSLYYAVFFGSILCSIILKINTIKLTLVKIKINRYGL